MSAPLPLEIDVTEDGWQQVRALAEDRALPIDGSQDDAVRALAAGLADGDASVLSTLDAIAGPDLVRLELEYGGRTAWLSCSGERVVAAVPDEGGRHVVSLGIDMLPALLARLVGLRPGPPGSSSRTPVHPQDLVGQVHRRWWLTRLVEHPDARPAGIEVWDTDAGWWSHEESGLRPVDATDVWATFASLYLGRDWDTGSVWPPPA